MTDLYLRPGIGSQDLLVIRCLKTWLLSISVVRMRQVGSTEVIPQWLMELSNGKSVSIGPLTTAVGLPTSVFATVVLSLCTSCLQHVTAICDTVGTGVQVQNDLNSVDFHVGKNHSANVIVSCLTCFHCLLLTDFGCFLRCRETEPFLNNQARIFYKYSGFDNVYIKQIHRNRRRTNYRERNHHSYAATSVSCK